METNAACGQPLPSEERLGFLDACPAAGGSGQDWFWSVLLGPKSWRAEAFLTSRPDRKHLTRTDTITLKQSAGPFLVPTRIQPGSDPDPTRHHQSYFVEFIHHHVYGINKYFSVTRTLLRFSLLPPEPSGSVQLACHQHHVLGWIF